MSRMCWDHKICGVWCSHITILYCMLRSVVFGMIAVWLSCNFSSRKTTQPCYFMSGRIFIPMRICCSHNILIGLDDSAKLTNFEFSATKRLSANAVEPICSNYRYAILSLIDQCCVQAVGHSTELWLTEQRCLNVARTCFVVQYRFSRKLRVSQHLAQVIVYVWF